MSQPDPAGQERLRETAEARELRAYLRTVGDTIRLQILRFLSSHDEMNVTELSIALRISQPLLSWHLGVLKRGELVSIRREGRLVWYSLNRASLVAYQERFYAWVNNVSGSLNQCEGEKDA
jgi:DNA-binding transcriptional ArsR family regulator